MSISIGVVFLLMVPITLPIRLVLPPIAVFIETITLQPDDDECHDGFDDAELKSGLLAES